MGEQQRGAALQKPERTHAPLWIDVSDRLSTGFLFSPLPVLADTSNRFIWRLLLPFPAPTDTLMSLSLRPLSDLSPPCSGVGDTGVDHIVVLGRGASFSDCAVHEVYEQCK